MTDAVMSVLHLPRMCQFESADPLSVPVQPGDQRGSDIEEFLCLHGYLRLIRLPLQEEACY
jgi:hypothetical protein